MAVARTMDGRVSVRSGDQQLMSLSPQEAREVAEKLLQAAKEVED